MKAIGYARVSTGKQDISLDVQKFKINAMATLKCVTLVDILVDDGKSGKDLNRPMAKAALDMVKRGQVGMLIIAKLDRLTRSVRDAIEIIDLVNRKKAALVSVEESFDTTSSMGRAMVKLMTTFAELERETIGERTRAAMQQMRRNGWTTGNAPYGYRSVGKKQPLEPVPAEQAGLARMKKLHAAGKSLREIAEQMNAEGIKTRSGGTWKFQYVQNILKGAK